MVWPTPLLRARREQTRDDVDGHVPGADARVPNTNLRALSEGQASLTHDNDLHLEYLARMMMPDKAEGEYVDRWANIWLVGGRKSATFAGGFMTVTGSPGSAVPTGAALTATVFDEDGQPLFLSFEVVAGVTLAAASAAVEVVALDAGAAGNLIEGGKLAFDEVPAGIDGEALVAAPGLAGGADSERDEDCKARYIDVIQNPPHGGSVNDYEQWMLAVPGVTRAWAAQEMGIGTITCRFMMDELRADTAGIPQASDVTEVESYIDSVRPVTVADRFVVAPVPQALDITITELGVDTPEVRANIEIELADMLRARARPGSKIFGSWISEAISSATGEDYHSGGYADVLAQSAGHIVVPGTITYA